MDNPTTWLVIVVFIGFCLIYLILDVLERTLKELTFIRQQIGVIDLKPLANEQAGQGARIQTIIHELYVLRRIAEERTGVSEEDVKDIDKERNDRQFDRVREIIKKNRDSSGESK